MNIVNRSNHIISTLIILSLSFQTSRGQIDSSEKYLPTEVGTSWFYKIYPDFSNEREKLIVTRDSISAVDSSLFIYINGNTKPRYRIDSLDNIYLNPLDSHKGANLLVLKQNARLLESWAMSDSLISGAKRVARIKKIGSDFILGKTVKYKEVEWGWDYSNCQTCSQDSFGLSPRSEYYAKDFGLYFAVVEPTTTERLLVGFISNQDTVGDVTKVFDLNVLHPSTFVLFPNYPNPFNSSTTIIYDLKSEQFVSLIIFDMLGREIQQLVGQNQSIGQHRIIFDAKGLNTGIYLFQLKAGSDVQSKKMIYLK